MPPPRVVLVGVDDSAPSRHAWAWAADSLLPTLPQGTRVVLACVAPPPFGTTDAMQDVSDAPWVLASGTQEAQEAAAAAQRAAEETLLRLLVESPAPKNVEVSRVAAHSVGSPGETLVQLQREHEADLVLLGSRGLGAAKRCAPRSRGHHARCADSSRVARARGSLLAGIADALALGQLGSVSSYCVCVPIHFARARPRAGTRAHEGVFCQRPRSASCSVGAIGARALARPAHTRAASRLMRRARRGAGTTCRALC